MDTPSPRLTETEFRLAFFLAKASPRMVRRDQILEHLYGSRRRWPDRKIIDAFICKLRKKLPDGAIGCAYGAGYTMRPDAAQRFLIENPVDDNARPCPCCRGVGWLTSDHAGAGFATPNASSVARTEFAA